MNKTCAAIVLIVAVLGSALGVVYSKHQSRKLFNELQALEAHRDNLEIEWELLQLEQSTLATEAVVDQVARSRLGMIVPDPGSVVYIRR